VKDVTIRRDLLMQNLRVETAHRLSTEKNLQQASVSKLAVREPEKEKERERERDRERERIASEDIA
jgi:hypothetical protein